jgi:hypothetical protein
LGHLVPAPNFSYQLECKLNHDKVTFTFKNWSHEQGGKRSSAEILKSMPRCQLCAIIMHSAIAHAADPPHNLSKRKKYTSPN